MTDAELCTAISSGGEARLRAIETIYSWQDMKEKVTNYVRRHGGEKSDGLEIYHDGIVAMDKNIRLGKFRGESSVQGYLYSICRFIWNNEWRRRMKTRTTDLQDFELEPDHDTPEMQLRSQEEVLLLNQVLALLDASCKKILTLWKQSYSMSEIATELQLSSPQMAKKYRYRCMQKLMKELENHPLLFNALKHV